MKMEARRIGTAGARKGAPVDLGVAYSNSKSTMIFRILPPPSLPLVHLDPATTHLLSVLELALSLKQRELS